MTPFDGDAFFTSHIKLTPGFFSANKNSSPRAFPRLTHALFTSSRDISALSFSTLFLAYSAIISNIVCIITPHTDSATKRSSTFVALPESISSPASFTPSAILSALPAI